MFAIDIDDLFWIENRQNDPNDLCAHAHARARIGEECFAYDATVSATALYLLKSLTENHMINTEIQLLPCCGFSVYARGSQLDTVDIIGCPNGIDWSVIHGEGTVKLVTQSGLETLLLLEDYRQKVYNFADRIEAFYRGCTPKILPKEKEDREGYIAFWNEWHRLRK